MSNIVSSMLRQSGCSRAGTHGEGQSLYARNGARKYLNAAERQRALDAACILPDDEALFLRTLAWTGARISEVLALAPSSFQLEAGLVTIRTLKRRRLCMREVPLLPGLMTELDSRYDLSAAQLDPHRAFRPLWRFSRTTAWRLVKRVMQAAAVTGPRACPRGMRHGFAVAALKVVPLNLLQVWMGHSRLSTTAIYAAACGPDSCGNAAPVRRSIPRRWAYAR